MLNVSNLIGGVISVGPAVSQPVEALNWDITLGTAGTGFGQYILGKMSSSSEMIPEAVDHVGVVVYGYLYEYGDLGILKTPAALQSNPESKYPVFNLRNREKLGHTEKSQHEFEGWVSRMNQTEFVGRNYNVVTQSCVVWGIKACEYLDVPYPENWDKVMKWVSENSTVAGLIGGSGIQSRKVQIKAQAAKAPRKLANYFKKKFRKKKRTSIDDANAATTSVSSNLKSPKTYKNEWGDNVIKKKLDSGGTSSSLEEDGSNSSSSDRGESSSQSSDEGKVEKEESTVTITGYSIEKLTVSITKL